MSASEAELCKIPEPPGEVFEYRGFWYAVLVDRNGRRHVHGAWHHKHYAIAGRRTLLRLQAEREAAEEEREKFEAQARYLLSQCY